MNFHPHKCSRELERNSDLLLITGDGRSLPDDLDRFLSWDIGHDVMAIGRSINYYPGKVKHWANVDGEESKWWAEHLRGNPIRHTMGDCAGFDVDWGIENCELKPDDILWHGSTSLFSAYIGLEMGYEKIILAGCPLDRNGHWYFGNMPDNEGPAWKDQSYEAWHEFWCDTRSDRVRSFSGFTAEVLGKPTKEWASA